MKKMCVILVFLLAPLLSAQTFGHRTALFQDERNILPQIAFGNYCLDFKKFDCREKPLTIANSATLLTDTYISNGDGSYRYKNSALMFSSGFGRPVDSLNPTGTNSLAAFFVFPLLNNWINR